MFYLLFGLFTIIFVAPVEYMLITADFNVLISKIVLCSVVIFIFNFLSLILIKMGVQELLLLKKVKDDGKLQYAKIIEKSKNRSGFVKLRMLMYNDIEFRPIEVDTEWVTCKKEENEWVRYKILGNRLVILKDEFELPHYILENYRYLEEEKVVS